MKTLLVAVALLWSGIVAADPYLDAVVSTTIGTGGGGNANDPQVVFGPPRGAGARQGSLDVISLGLNGQIVVAFTDNVVVDGPGADFTVFENAFLKTGLTTLEPFAEPATVSVSADGTTWTTFPCALDAPPYHPGCAGIYPVFANADDPAAPSPLVSSMYHDEATIAAMNAMNLSVSAIGNHELDEGPAELLRMKRGGCHPVEGCSPVGKFRGAKFEYLSANVVHADT